MKAIDVWHRRQVGTVPISDVAYGNGQFVAIGRHSVFTSPTGVVWNEHALATLPGDAVLASLVFFDSADRFVAIYNRTWWEIPPEDPKERESWALMLSRDGSVLGPAVPIGILANRLVAEGNLLVAVGLGIVYSEDGGGTWHDAQSQTPLSYEIDDPRVYLSDVCLGKNAAGSREWMAVGWHKNIASYPPSYEMFWATSDDGKVWEGNRGMPLPLDCVAYGHAAFVASDNYYTHDRFYFLEHDNNYWNVDNYRTTGRVNGLAFGAGVFVAVGDNGYVYVSSNGQTWDSRIIPSSGSLRAVRYCGDTFIALGEDGEIFQSEQCLLPFLTVELFGAKPATVRVQTESGLDVLCSHSTGIAIDTKRWGKALKLTASGGVGREMKQVMIPGNGTVLVPGTTWLTFFDYWSGAVSGKSATASVVMDTDKTVAAVFTYKFRFPLLQTDQIKTIPSHEQV
jgi:hypothetical protein